MTNESPKKKDPSLKDNEVRMMLHIDKQLKKQFKIVCAMNEVSMINVIRRLMEYCVESKSVEIIKKKNDVSISEQL